ncbi:aldehyde dehydrogenase family protein [Kineosporia rhizophila]|uniref:aldehyde dehydrogenase family protein n=1 Tax=Kineosporia rhizophila TaxID=84633 RepID=UPI001E4200EF|nr:aldehyde dehydrogenase family protein [Kineosporia rhizophila]MCE0540672.1 aldehyde dehydrogenase family protein [Kineosporia rhizophila]
MPMRTTSALTMTVAGTAAQTLATFEVTDPATGRTAGLAPDATREQLDDAVASARAAQPGWAALSLPQRRTYLEAMADAIDDSAGELAELVTAEQGKPLPLALAEVAGLSLWLRRTAPLDLPETVNQDDAERLSVTRRLPLGVVAAITPWNYPLGQLSFKLGPALLAGNTVVIKPSGFTPLSSLRLGEILRDVVPAGVVSVITGRGGLGAWVSTHPGFDKISFTGSTATGRDVMSGAGATLTRVTLELGGNDPAIVLPDAGPDEVSEKLFWAAFSNAGQICLASKRIYVHADIYEQVAERLVRLADQVSVGDGRTEGVQIGPVSNRRQYDTVLDLLRDSLEQGHDILTGGLPGPELIAQGGLFIRPTIIGNPPESARIVQEEQFGPVLPLLRYTDVDEVIALANAGEYGLGASVWSADTDAALAVARRITSGTVWVNEVMHLSPLVPFGGLGQSGIGVESGSAGLLEFTERQTITLKR